MGATWQRSALVTSSHGRRRIAVAIRRDHGQGPRGCPCLPRNQIRETVEVVVAWALDRHGPIREQKWHFRPCASCSRAKSKIDPEEPRLSCNKRPAHQSG